jgi:hypothetical protein
MVEALLASYHLENSLSSNLIRYYSGIYGLTFDIPPGRL